jgi:hypothetical protein
MSPVPSRGSSSFIPSLAARAKPTDFLSAAEQIVGSVLPRGILARNATEAGELMACACPIVFRYEYGAGGTSGGYGDCLKGLITAAQIAYLLGCPIRLDFSRHPIGTALPWASDLLLPSELNNISDARFFDVRNQESVIRSRDALFASMAPPASALRTTGAVIMANIMHLRQLAAVLPSLSEESMVQLERAMWGSLYVSAIDGVALSSLWPLRRDAASPYRIAVHVRMGDKLIPGLTVNTSSTHPFFDERIKDSGELTAALGEIGEFARRHAARGRDVGDVFICADTQVARDLMRVAIEPQGFSVFEAPAPPVHIGYAASFSHGAQKTKHVRSCKSI